MDMESFYEMINTIQRVVNILVNAWVTGLFVKPFLNRKRTAKVICASYVCVMAILYFMPYEISGTAAYGIGIAVSFVVLAFSDNYNLLQKVFLAVTAYLIHWIASGIVLVPWNGIWALSVDRVAGNAQEIRMGMFLFVEMLYIILENAALYFMVRIIHKVYLRKKEIMNRKEMFLLLSPYLSIVSGYFVIQFLSQAYEKDMNQYIWNTHIGYRGFVAIYQVLSFLAIVAGIMSYQWIKEAQEDELQRAVIVRQMGDMKSHVDKVEELYQGIRGMKHDINNHILVLEDLLEKGEKKEAGKYLSDMRKSYEDSGFSVKTGNPVTDVIISEKQKEAQEKGLEFFSRFGFPESGSISTYDISVILGNVLSNAIDAAENSREKNVQIASIMRNRIYLIEVRNSFEGFFAMDEDSGFPLSTKDMGEGHGYGLRNVRKVAEKYFGAVDFEAEQGTVRVTVMLVIPE